MTDARTHADLPTSDLAEGLDFDPIALSADRGRSPLASARSSRR
jgi:hypothetical protein